ncbi:MAG: hypothetical protein JWR42_691 [Marmoricola sp.]|jgi:hypothetical protein|nr:hypothetical protein [Marmoricola sp.]
MFFWIGLVVVLVVFVALLSWGSRGIDDRFHEPGTQHLNLPRKDRRGPKR